MDVNRIGAHCVPLTTQSDLAAHGRSRIGDAVGDLPGVLISPLPLHRGFSFIVQNSLEVALTTKAGDVCARQRALGLICSAVAFSCTTHFSGTVVDPKMEQLNA
jgi:hypothetical protein